jgi:hypothetical protein
VRFLALMLCVDTERREAVLIVINESTRSYPRSSRRRRYTDERAVEERGHFSAMGWYGGGVDAGISNDDASG